MASTLPTPLECCQTCTDPVDVNVPGAQGEPGTDGTDGTNGLNAFGTIVGGEIIPAWGDTVVIELTDPPGSGWMAATQVVYIKGLGYFEVVSTPTDTSVELENLGYPGNDAGGGFFTALLRIQPAGIRGAAGSSPTDALLKTNNLNDVTSASDSRDNLGLGTSATKDTGIATGKLPLVDAPGLTAGRAVFGTATGIETKSAANAQTALGLGDMAVQNAAAVTITGGVITGITDLAVADGGTGASTAAAARTNLGIGVLSVVTKVALYNASATDDVILCDATGGVFTVNLPAAAAATGHAITIKKIDVSGNAVTIDGSGAELIDGAATQSLPAQWDVYTMVSNGSAWFLF